MELKMVLSRLLMLLSSFIFASVADNVERKAFIVYMGCALENKSLAAEHHHNLLLEVTQDEEVARQSIIYSYGKSFNAFSAYLLPDEAQRLRENENVVSVFPSKEIELFTTNSWDFIGMPLSVERIPQIESDIIIGIIDSGIDMDSPSFNDKGFGPPPSKWKGVCQVGANVSGCNNKVIGARIYVNSSEHPWTVADQFGHGTHVASTAAGVAVKGASFYGLGEGTAARGGVPSARIAVYKVHDEAEILAALDDAIDDGVDILSLSIGIMEITSYFEDAIAIGSFHAMKKGILISAAVGNYGPEMDMLRNGAPWILSVGATTTNRQFRTPLIIGNSLIIMGVSWNFFNNTCTYPLNRFRFRSKRKSAESVAATAIANDDDDDDDIKGKILYMNEVIGDYEDRILKNKGAAGLIFHCQNDHAHYATRSYLIPCACVHPSIAHQIENYINSTNNPVASIHKSIVVQDKSAPIMASFSSRGPDPIARSIIKPDIVAPGVEILGARSKYLGTGPDYEFMFGTSASCPHASGAAAYVKSFHPRWSPTAIKSALITTAYEIKSKDENAEFAYGAGHIHPTKALHPGLVYDMDTMDYVRFLCNLGYSEKDLKKIIGEGDTVDCSSIPKFGGEDDLNYPSMVVMHKDPHSNISAVFYRTVRNVGDANSRYKAKVRTSTSNVHITVTPDTLAFKEIYEELSFTVEVKGPSLKSLNDNAISSSLIWTNSVHNVRSAILIFPAYKLEVN